MLGHALSRSPRAPPASRDQTVPEGLSSSWFVFGVCRCDLLLIKHRGSDNLLNNACSVSGALCGIQSALATPLRGGTNRGFRGRGFHDKRPRVKWQLGDQESAGRFLGSRVQIGLHSFTVSIFYALVLLLLLTP